MIFCLWDVTFLYLFIICAICLSSWFSFFDLSSLAFAAHKQCLNWVSFKSEWIDIYQALMCGRRLPHGAIKTLFVKGGLIHLMVISGAHLLFLERFWRRLKFPFFPSLGTCILLTIYALSANFHPPVLRALFSFFLLQIVRSNKLFWSPFITTHLSGLLCLIYSPSWIHSTSLQLSWIASLIQSLSVSKMKNSFLTYLFIFPICNQWLYLHPLTVLINWIMAPFIGSVLFPLSVLVTVFNPLHKWVDFLWDGILWILKKLQIFMPQNSIPLTLSENVIWIYVIFIFGINGFYVLYKKRTLFPIKKVT